jgi:hypothetical protein
VNLETKNKRKKRSGKQADGGSRGGRRSQLSGIVPSPASTLSYFWANPLNSADCNIHNAHLKAHGLPLLKVRLYSPEEQ